MKKTTILIICFIFLILFGWFKFSVLQAKFFPKNEIIPPLGEMDQVEMVYTGVHDQEFYFIYEDGSISDPFHVFVQIIDGGGFSVDVDASRSNITWSPEGDFFTLTAGPYGPAGYPLLVSSSGEIITCTGENLPYSKGRVWILEGMKVVSTNSVVDPETVVIYDFKFCQVEKILYEANQDEYLYEATLSSQGWLAISINAKSSHTIIKIIDPAGNEYLIPDGVTPSWSADGEKLAFVIIDEGLFYSDKSGDNITLVEEEVSNDIGLPTWSPDGDWIAYGYYHLNEFNIFKINIHTSEKVLIVENGYSPNWRWNNTE